MWWQGESLHLVEDVFAFGEVIVRPELEGDRLARGYHLPVVVGKVGLLLALFALVAVCQAPRSLELVPLVLYGHIVRLFFFFFFSVASR